MISLLAKRTGSVTRIASYIDYKGRYHRTLEARRFLFSRLKRSKKNDNEKQSEGPSLMKSGEPSNSVIYTRTALADLETALKAAILGKEWSSSSTFLLTREDATAALQALWLKYSSVATAGTTSEPQQSTSGSMSFIALMDKYKVFSKLKDAASDLLDLVPASIMTDDLKMALRDVAKLSETFYLSLGKLKLTFQHPFLVNLGLLRLYERKQNEAGKNARTTSAVPESLSDDERVKVLRFLMIADAVYDTVIPIQAGDIILNRLNDSTAIIPAHIVFVDHLTKSIVVAITGTRTLHDLFIDLKLDTRPFAGLESSGAPVRAHRGMADSAEAILPAVQAAVEKAQKQLRMSGRTDYEVVLTGHSLGAGTATLLGILLEQLVNTRVTVYAFASPPVITSVPGIDTSSQDTGEAKQILRLIPFYRKLSDRKSKKNLKILNFINNNDIISRCSHYDVLDLISILKSIDSLPWTAAARTSMIIRDRISDEEVAEVERTVSRRVHLHDPADSCHLLVPGNIYWMSPFQSKDKRKLGSPQYEIWRIADPSCISKGLFFPGDSIVSDHFVKQYVSAYLNSSFSSSSST
jgi:hypothetical protein